MHGGNLPPVLGKPITNKKTQRIHRPVDLISCLKLSTFFITIIMRFCEKLLLRIVLLTNLFIAVFSFTFNSPNTRHSIQSNPSISEVACSPLKHETKRFSNIFVLFDSKKDKYVEAENLPAIQTLFSKHCDKEGLMTKDELEKVPPFAEMLVSLDGIGRY